MSEKSSSGVATRVLVLAGCYGAFQRAFLKPTLVDQAKLHATYHYGVLALRLPIRDAASQQGIPITNQRRRRT